MTRQSVQIGVRATPEVVAELRQEANRLGLPLGATIGDLLQQRRSELERGPGIWVELPSQTMNALRALASAERRHPAEVLSQLVASLSANALRRLADQVAQRGRALDVERVPRAVSAAEPRAEGARTHLDLPVVADHTRPVTPAERTQAWMLAEGVSQRQMAAMLGTHQSMLSRWLAGKSRPRPRYRQALKQLTGIDWS